MGKYIWTVTYDADGSPTVLSNIQGMQISYGRTGVQDPFRASTATISGRRPDLLPTITIGQDIAMSGNSGDAYTGIYWHVVSNFKINYGIIPSLDTWTITTEDALAKAGRAQFASALNITAGTTTRAAAEQICIANGISLDYLISDSPGSTVSAQTFAVGDNVMTALQRYATTEQAVIYGSDPSQINWQSRKAVGTIGIRTDFTDETLTTTNPKTSFDVVNFLGIADNYFPKVIVEPAGLAAQTVGTGNRVFNASSYDQTTTQASSLAGYIKNTLSVSQSVPQSVSCTDLKQTNGTALFAAQIGRRVGIILRGVRYECFVQGGTVTVTPSQTRLTFNLSSADVYSFLRLNDAVFGRLDFNKLGF